MRLPMRLSHNRNCSILTSALQKPVAAICALRDGFVSAGEDKMLRFWTSQGQSLRILSLSFVPTCGNSSPEVNAVLTFSFSCNGSFISRGGRSGRCFGCFALDQPRYCHRECHFFTYVLILVFRLCVVPRMRWTGSPPSILRKVKRPYAPQMGRSWIS